MQLPTILFNKFGRCAAVVATLLALAACGGGGGSPGTATPGGTAGRGSSSVTAVGAVSLLFSSPQLKSAGTTSGAVTVTALVKSSSNVALENIPVTFSADSGALSNVSATTDKNGQATASLGTGGDRTNRRITVNVTAGSTNSKTASGTVDVVGTTVAITGPTAIASNDTGTFNIAVADSSGSAIANAPVTVTSQKGNPISVKTSNGGTASTPLTNDQGIVVVTLTASQSGNDTFTASAQGTSASSTINVNASKLTVAVTDSSGTVVTTSSTTSSCRKVAAHYEVGGVPQSGSVSITTSRGQIYSDSACSTALTSSTVALVSGDSNPTYLKSNTAGVATVTATASTGLFAQTDVEFIASLTSSSTISLQAEPAVVGPNNGTSTTQLQSALTAVVRDGTVYDNLVKNANVEFSIVSDASGGKLSNPAVITTASNGSASVSFIPGAGVTPQNGVTIRATIQGTSISTTKSLTVAKQALFIAAGTGNTLSTPSSATYQQDYAVFVTDAAGNPVSNVTVTATVIPTRYFKGTLSFDSTTAKAWVPRYIATCANEDVNKNGILDTGEDYNLNGILDPGMPVSVMSNGVTDSTGTTTISLRYPRNQAQWLEIQLEFHATVAGTESYYVVPAYVLPALASDLTNANVAPPGMVSPYGVNACNMAN